MRRPPRAVPSDILRARNIGRAAGEIGVSREGIYNALSEDGDPTFATAMRAARVSGMQLRVAVLRQRQKARFEARRYGLPYAAGRSGRDPAFINASMRSAILCAGSRSCSTVQSAA